MGRNAGTKDGGSSPEEERPNSPGYVRQKQLPNPTAGRLDALGKGRLVDVGVFPMGIDVARLDEWRMEPEVADWIAMLKEKYQGMKLVVGRDKLDEIQVGAFWVSMEAFLLTTFIGCISEDSSVRCFSHQAP